MAKKAIKKAVTKTVTAATIVTAKEPDRQSADAKALNAKIKAWGAAYKSVSKDGHDIAARCVVHAIQYGDVRPATRFIAAMGKDNKTFARANMFRGWLEKHGPFKWDKETDGFKCRTEKQAELKPKLDKRGVPGYLTDLMKQAPWEKSPEPEYKGFDFIKRLQALIKQGQRAEKEHGSDPKTDTKGLEEARALLAKLAENAANEDDEDADGIEATANVA